jgi:hypothetical protein
MIENLLDELAELYNDSNKKINFQRQYSNLTQESNKFSEFYSLFQRLSSYLDYHEKQLIINLQDKIISCLRVV